MTNNDSSLKIVQAKKWSSSYSNILCYINYGVQAFELVTIGNTEDVLVSVSFKLHTSVSEIANLLFACMLLSLVGS